MRYRVYGQDSSSKQPREPLVVEAGSEDEARGRAVARGMAVRAVIADGSPNAHEPTPEPPPPPPRSEHKDEETAGQPEEMRGLQRFVLLVVFPIALAFFLMLAILRTILQSFRWSFVWLVGTLLGGGIGGLLGWVTRGTVPATSAWPIGLAVGLAVVSGAHGARIGWRWWWAKRSLSPLAQALGAAPEEDEEDEDFSRLRIYVALAQGLAGAVLGTVGGLIAWYFEWHGLSVVGWTLGGALGLGLEGAILGTLLARHRPQLVPGVATDETSVESLAGLLSRMGAISPSARRWAVGYAIDRGVPGAVAGTFVGIVATLLGWCVLG